MRPLPLIVLRALLSKQFFLQFHKDISPELFGDMLFRSVYSHIAALHESNDGDLSLDMLLGYIDVKYSGDLDKVEELQSIVFDMMEVDEISPEQVRQLVAEWVQRTQANKLAEYIANHVHSPDFSLDVLTDYVERAMAVTDSLDTKVLEYDQAPLYGASDLGPIRISLGFSPKLDACLGGGIGVGELSILIAPPGRGKTSFLLYAGAHAARKGYRVLHITLEINEAMVVRRYDQALTGKSREELAIEPGLIKQARQQISDAGGALYIKDWSHAAINANDILALVRRMRAHGKDVNYIIIDYLGLMTAVNANRENRFNFSNIAKEVRAMGVQLGVPVLTAWQVNRAGSTEEYLEADDVAECWDIVMHADTILGLNQNRAERHAKRMRINVIKQRQSTSGGQFTLVSDMDKMIIRPVTLEDDGIDLRTLAKPGKAQESTDSSPADASAEVQGIRQGEPGSAG